MSDEAKTAEHFMREYCRRMCVKRESFAIADVLVGVFHDCILDSRIKGAEAQRMTMRKAWDDCEGSEVMAWCAAFNDTDPRAVVEALDAK